MIRQLKDIVSSLQEKPWKINLLLFLCSFGIYFIYFPHVFLSPNSVLSSITGDALKNYYTYSYHIKNDTGTLHFSGMNFPFGEHVVFTDCQPVLTFILRLLPFTHTYLIGILHLLLFSSYILTPLILNKILLRFRLDAFSAFFISMAVTLLSPQFAKINGGHHALAYGCMIPFSILLLLNVIQHPGRGNVLRLFFFNLFLFFLHPYMGFSTSLFCFLALLVHQLLSFDKRTMLLQLCRSVFAGLLPLFLFQLFMKLSDQHTNRTVEPHGSKTLIENTDSLLAPDFGPFKQLLESLFPDKTPHLEGHSYLGAFTLLLCCLLILLLPFLFRRLQFKKELSALFISAFFLLIISFGWHIKVLEFFHIKSGALNQFRATCRFAWFFYYMLPLFVVPALYHAFIRADRTAKVNFVFPVMALLFFTCNMWEAHYYFKKDETHFWKFRNILNEKFLNEEEKTIVQHILTSKTQAIIPLPIFVLGSEMYDRFGADYSMIPSMLYSYHTGVPIFGAAMSRTSISETEDLIQLFNSYKKDNPAMKYLSDAPFLVIKTTDPLMADEDRLLSAVNMFHKNDSLVFGTLTKEGLRRRKLDTTLITTTQPLHDDSAGVVYLPFENRKPFITSRMLDYETMHTQDSNTLKTGSYIMSFHYHYTRKVYTSLNIALIITRKKGAEFNWQHYQRISLLSGFYPGFAVMEYKVDLEKDCRYEFILKGEEDREYKISHFMLRPEHTSVIAVEKRDSSFNNFPD